MIISATPPDWGIIINAISLGVVVVLTAWMKLRDKSLARMERTLNKVQRQTDGAITAAKLAVAISAQNLAVATGLDRDQKIADEAQDAYEQQRKVQEQAEKEQSKG